MFDLNYGEAVFFLCVSAPILNLINVGQKMVKTWLTIEDTVQRWPEKSQSHSDVDVVKSEDQTRLMIYIGESNVSHVATREQRNECHGHDLEQERHTEIMQAVNEILCIVMITNKAVLTTDR